MCVCSAFLVLLVLFPPLPLPIVIFLANFFMASYGFHRQLQVGGSDGGGGALIAPTWLFLPLQLRLPSCQRLLGSAFFGQNKFSKLVLAWCLLKRYSFIFFLFLLLFCGLSRSRQEEFISNLSKYDIIAKEQIQVDQADILHEVGFKGGI